MKKFFNIAGPCHPAKHYMLPTQERCQGLFDLIEQEQYFVIHAARQSGKTTLLFELEQQLNVSGKYQTLYCSLEALQGIEDAKEGIPLIVAELRAEIGIHADLQDHSFAQQAHDGNYANMLRLALSAFCGQLTRPLVILFDEIDCLANGTLISFLRQLRYGYVNRSRAPFVHALVLVGMRNIRDYKAHIRDERDTLGSASPFNIAKVSKTLRNFTRAEIAALYAQHTAVTGQSFPPDMIDRVSAWTQGQPWLVNAIACEIIENILRADVAQPILADDVDQAVHAIILRRATHVDSLMERLREERVRKIVESVIIGERKRYDLLDDDYRYVLDLGLLREDQTTLVPANPIYGEIIVRTLNFRSQLELGDLETVPDAPAYLVAGRLDMTKLLRDFQQFWRENSDIWIKKYEYQEAAPHLILQAFLQRIINARGQVTREMAAGTQRLDLCLHYQGVKYPLELKLRYSQKTYTEGASQLAAYMDTLGCAEGWLIVFDRRKKTPWKQKIFWRTQQLAEKTIHLVGC